MSAAIALAVAQGVAELVKLGIVSAQSAHEAEEVLVRAMRPTPSDEEVERYRDAMDRLRAKPGPDLWGDPGTLTPEQAEANEEIGRILAARDTDPAAPPPATRLDEEEVL